MGNTHKVKPKVLILSDGQGWVVDRISNEFRSNLGDCFNIDVAYYTDIDPSKLVELGTLYDLVHYQNSDIGRFVKTLPLKCPFILSIRSFRYPAVALEAAKLATKVHVINEELKKDFPGSVYIPDPLDNLFAYRPFVVGMVAQDIPGNSDYKGVGLVKEACEKWGAKLVVANNICHEKMPEWYRSLDLFVCASKEEGFGHPIIEAYSMGVPVVSTSVGVAKKLGVTIVDRNVASIAEAIYDYMADADLPAVHPFAWHVLKKKYVSLYRSVL